MPYVALWSTALLKAVPALQMTLLPEELMNKAPQMTLLREVLTNKVLFPPSP
jgi:hypothetical protein